MLSRSHRCLFERADFNRTTMNERPVSVETAAQKMIFCVAHRYVFANLLDVCIHECADLVFAVVAAEL